MSTQNKSTGSLAMVHTDSRDGKEYALDIDYVGKNVQSNALCLEFATPVGSSSQSACLSVVKKYLII